MKNAPCKKNESPKGFAEQAHLIVSIKEQKNIMHNSIEKSNMKKILATATLLTLSFFALQISSHAETTTKTQAHFIAWGDEEGFIERPGDDLKETNQALPVLMEKIKSIDKSDSIDALLHTGDFVRFDPNEKYHQQLLGDYLNKFYPTSGGDQEFYYNRYYNFLINTPHLKKLYVDRSVKDGNGLELYYNTVIKDTHIISLYSPDEYREYDKSPQFRGQNFYVTKTNMQYKWLENLLNDIRVKNLDKRPIIILSHGPLFNQSKLLVELFEKYKVELVLNGDAHILAHKKYKGTNYIITGMMGDRYLGGCEDDSKNNPEFIEKYSLCLPEKMLNRKKGEPFKFYNDHYLDIHISKNYLKVQAIDLETGKSLLDIEIDKNIN